VDRAKLDTLDGTPLVDWFTNDIHNAAQSTLPDRNLNGGTSVDNLLSPDETLGTVHSNGSDRVLTKMSSDLKDETAATEVLDFESIENRWQVLCLELNIYDSTDDGLDVTTSSGSLRGIRTRSLLFSANWPGIGGGVGSGRKGRP